MSERWINFHQICTCGTYPIHDEVPIGTVTASDVGDIPEDIIEKIIDGINKASEKGIKIKP